MNHSSRKKKSDAEKDLSLTLVAEPAEYFREELHRAFKKQNFPGDTDIEFYLVDMLKRFMLTENFFKVDENGNKRQETLALLLSDAVCAADPAKKVEDLKRLGDVSLYTAGFFNESLSRKIVDVDYYIGMGSSAYKNLSSLVFDAHFQKVFHKLSEHFVKFVDVLCEISANTSMGKNAQDVLRTYELWLKTGSERAEKSLKEAGIIPNAKIKTSIQ